MTQDRFVRQRLLVPREKITDLTFTIVGVGAVGRNVALTLASMGAMRITLYDMDTVEDHNVTTQGFPQAQVGQRKVDAVKADILRVDPEIEVDALHEEFERGKPTGDVVFCCVDSMKARRMVWTGCKHSAKFFADARVMGEVINVLAVKDPQTEPFEDGYEASIFDDSEALPGACGAQMTIYSAMVAAGMMANQFARWLREADVDPLVSYAMSTTMMSLGKPGRLALKAEEPAAEGEEAVAAGGFA